MFFLFTSPLLHCFNCWIRRNHMISCCHRNVAFAAACNWTLSHSNDFFFLFQSVHSNIYLHILCLYSLVYYTIPSIVYYIWTFEKTVHHGMMLCVCNLFLVGKFFRFQFFMFIWNFVNFCVFSTFVYFRINFWITDHFIANFSTSCSLVISFQFNMNTGKWQSVKYQKIMKRQKTTQNNEVELSQKFTRFHTNKNMVWFGCFKAK